MIEKHKANGVIFLDNSAFIEDTVSIEPGVKILPGVMLLGETIIRAGAVIGPNTLIENSEIGAEAKVNASQVYDSKIGEKTTVGPFAHVRGHAEIGKECRIGNFVEIKKSKIADKTKISHLSYIGDAILGSRVNIGCGTITVNYDGVMKHLTEIDDDAFIGCNSNLIAPVKIGKGALVAAGSTVTKNVPDDALCVARNEQTIRDGYAKKIFERKRREKEENNK